MIIYKITNTITQKSYIGQTRQSLKRRWSQHKKCYHNNHFSNAIKKYGTDCWSLEILEEVFDVNLLNEREIYWIESCDTFNNGYNSTSGGGQSRQVSEDTKKKLSEASKNRPPISEETRQKKIYANTGNKNPMFGRCLSEEQKITISQQMKNRTISDETRKKQSKSLKGHKVSEETRRKISESLKKKLLLIENRSSHL